jgi:hypothetical protein
VVVTAAWLVASVVLPGPGVFGPGSPPAQAAPVSAPAAPVQSLALPSTGVGAGARAGVSVGAGTGADTATDSAGACAAPCSTAQVISVTIKPGPFDVTGAPASLSMSTDGNGTGRGRLDGIRVTDLRGAEEGWTLSTRVGAVVDARSDAPVPGATVEVVPVCRRTAGPLTLDSADPSVVTVGGTASLCLVPVASSGSLAGGLVSAYADVVVRGAPADARVTVRFATSLS